MRIWRSRKEQDLDEEIRFHLNQETQLRIDRGEPAELARESAQRDFGNLGLVKEVTREMWGWRSMERLVQDLSYAARQLKRTPAFTVTAVITLALGIGANTAIFSINSLFFRSLPVKSPGDLVILAYQQKSGTVLNQFSVPDLKDIRSQTSGVFSDVFGYELGLQGLSVDGKSARMWGNYVTGNYFEALGLRPAVGRFILPSEDEHQGADPVLVLSYSYWNKRFNRDPGVVGKHVALNGHPFTVIGVAPEGFRGLNQMLDIEGFLPMSMATLEANSGDVLNDRANRNLVLMGRLAAGVTVRQAQTQLDVIATRLAKAYPKTNENLGLRAYPERFARPDPGSGTTTMIATALFLGLSALVLLLACINVGNILLVRASARERELAVRAALGAGRLRLIRQLLTESLLLALIGGVCGIFLGTWSAKAVGSVNLQSEIPLTLNFPFDWNIFAFTFGITLLTGGVVGIVPALRSSRRDLSDVLRGSARSVAAGRNRLRSALVVVQVAGSLTLLIVAALFLRSLDNTQRVDLGFDPNQVVNLTLDSNEAGLNESQGMELARTLLERAQTIPGVQSATMAFAVPMGYLSARVTLEIPGYQTAAGDRATVTEYNMIAPRYFETLRIPVLRGREFNDADTDKPPYVAVINEVMAEKYWPHQDPIGRRFRMKDEVQHTAEVVGIAKNSRVRGYSTAIQPYFYVPFAQNYTSFQTLQLRTTTRPELVLAELERLVGTVAPGVPVFGGQTMLQGLRTLNGALRYQISAGLAASLGLLGLVLALVGLYGVVAYSAAQRTHEIGIRMALGAKSGTILKMMAVQSLALVGAGLVFGIGAAFAAGRVFGGFLVGITGADPVTFVGVTLLLAIVALAACYVPARRATRIDPVVALRVE